MKSETPPPAPAGGGAFGRAAAALVSASLRAPRLVLLLSALLGALSVWVVATRFAMNTDVVRLFPEDLPWRRAEAAMDRAFPQRTELIAAVIDGATPTSPTVRPPRWKPRWRPARRCSARCGAPAPSPSFAAAPSCSSTRRRCSG